MKSITIIFFMLLFVFSAKAAHHMTYFVYVETRFAQGYWEDAGEVYDSGDKYLFPHQYTDLFGTIKISFYKKVLERLEEHHDFYSRVRLDSNELKKVGYREFYDTLNFAIESGLNDEQIKTLKNELTTTILNAGECRALRVRVYEEGIPVKTRIYDYDDVDYPVFSLVRMKKGRPPVTRIMERQVQDTVFRKRTDTVIERLKKDTLREVKNEKEEATKRNCWDRYLWLAIIAVLSVLLIRERRKQ
jgi:hypothetical protein